MKKLVIVVAIFALTAFDWAFGLVAVALVIGGTAINQLLEAEEREMRKLDQQIAESQARIEVIKRRAKDDRFRRFMEDDQI